MAAILFQDTFLVTELNEGGKKFDRVNRLNCIGTNHAEVEMVVDVNCELFKAQARDRVQVALARTLSLSGAPDDGKYNPSTTTNLADNYDYVMHGRVFAIKHVENHLVEVQASFGGLLFRLKGEQAQLAQFSMDMQFYIMMRSTGEVGDAMDM